MGMDKGYFDAKFEGLEKLMRSEKENTDSHINAVSKNAVKALDALVAHEQDPSAHGAEVSARSGANIVQWLGLLIATLAAISAIVPLLYKK